MLKTLKKDRSDSGFQLTALRGAVRSATYLLLVGGMSPLASLAQNSEDMVLEEVFVTGSRIARSDLSAPSPTTVVSEAFIRSSGNVTLEQTLNQLPQLRPNGTSTSNVTGGAGVLAADLRGLGRNRTLMLVNGKRFAPANADGQSDMVVEIERADGGTEYPVMRISDAGDYWLGDGRLVDTPESTVRVGFLYENEPWMLDFPASFLMPETGRNSAMADSDAHAGH